MKWGRRVLGRVTAFSLFVSALGVATAAPAAADAPSVINAPGFSLTEVFSGLNAPVATRFAPDGRIFVAEKRGVVKVFSNLSDPTPDLLTDLSSAVYDWWDRGLLGLAVDPNFPANPYVYVLYTTDIAGYNDLCPSPPGANTDGCMANARLSRIEVSTNNNQPLSINHLLDGYWCQQYPSHSIGTLAFGPDGSLYVGAGDGASFTFVDFGQGGGTQGDPPPTPQNPCDDPINEGGSLRSQDLRTSEDSVSYDGTILRINPQTGAAWPTNPLIGGAADDDRIVAYGLRNPFRYTVRPGTNELWIGDVGWGETEEINRLNPAGPVVENFGWPCYEGNATQGNFDPLNLSICENLYAEELATGAAHTEPYFTYAHSPSPNGCSGTGGAAIAGVAFYAGGDYPSQYDDALFFADYPLGCIRVMLAGAGGLPNPSTAQTIVTNAKPVDLAVGPGGDLFYTDLDRGAVYRLEYDNAAPTAVALADPTIGTAPLAVQFDGSQSTDPESDPLTYAWDLDGDGQYDDSFVVGPSWIFGTPGLKTVGLRVSDGQGSDTDSVTVNVTINQAPSAVISSPLASMQWTVGQSITFSGQGTDPEDGILGNAAHSWKIIVNHCETPTDCHQHVEQTFAGIKSGSFFAPDHDYPAHLTVELTVTDSGNLSDTASVDIYPQTSGVTFNTSPTGLGLVVGAESGPAPLVETGLVGGQISINAPLTQPCGASTCAFASWSDGGAASHFVTVLPTATSYTATYNVTGGGGGGGGGGVPPATFTDVPAAHIFFAAVEWLAASEITKGCSSTAFCPDEAVTRGQMAAFLTRALKLTAPPGVDTFTDDEGSIFETEIEALYAAGITVGCSPTAFCPDDPVTRGQMAAFLTRALKLTAPPGVDTFTDDEGSIFENQIEAIYVAGITVGCGPGVFCPDQHVTRGQMAAFLYRALSGV